MRHDRGWRQQGRTTSLTTSVYIMASSPVVTQPDQMALWRAKKDARRATVQSKYSIQGFISSGTYGRVYKARERGPGDAKDGLPGSDLKMYAIKKFKPEKEGEILTYTGISQSAIREIAVGINLFLLL
jgi:cyclin-dependent kinase 8/11